MQDVLVCNLPVRSGGLSNPRLDALIKEARIEKDPDNNFLRTKRDKCLALSLAGSDNSLKAVKASEAFKLLGANRVAAAGRIGNSLTEVQQGLEDAQEKLLRAEPPVPCDANAAAAAGEWHTALVDIQTRLTNIKRMHGRTLGLAQTAPDKQRLIAEMKHNQYAIKAALEEVTEKLQQTHSTAENLASPAMVDRARQLDRVRVALSEEVGNIDGHIKEVQTSPTSENEEGTSESCREACAEAERTLAKTRALLKTYTDLLPSVQDADKLLRMRDALETRAASMKDVMRTAKDTVDRVLNRLGALDGEVQGLDSVMDNPTKLAKFFRSIDALMVQHDEAVADASSAQRGLKDAHSSMQSLQRDLADLVRLTGERVDASELADSAEMIAKLKRHISGSGGLTAALSNAKETHTELSSQGQDIEGKLVAILQGLDESLNPPLAQHGGEQEAILRTIELIEQKMTALIEERSRMQREMQEMTTKFQSDINLRTRALNDRLTTMQEENEQVLERVHRVVERMAANNQAMRGIAESISNIDSQTIASITNEQVALLEDLRDAEARLNHSIALTHKAAYEASNVATPTIADSITTGNQVPAELTLTALQRVRDETKAAIGERDDLTEKLGNAVSRESELTNQPNMQDYADEVTALRGEIRVTEQRIADQEARIRVQGDIISKLPREVKALEDGDGAAKERLVAIESGLYDRVSQKDAAIQAIDSERNPQDSLDRETLRARTDAMIKENNARLRQITMTLEQLKSEIESGGDPAQRAVLQEERERTQRAQELHRAFASTLSEHKAEVEIPTQAAAPLYTPGAMSHAIIDSQPVTSEAAIDQQRVLLEQYQEELLHQKQEIDRLTSQEAVNTQVHEQYNALKQQAEAVSNQLIELLAPFGGNADALRSLVAEYAASNQRTRELTSENEQLREDLAATRRTMAEEYDKRIQELQVELASAQKREAVAKADTLETRRRADDVALELHAMQDSTAPLQGLPVLRFDEHHHISGEPAQAVRDIVKDYTFLRDDYGVVQSETRDRIVAILRSLNSGSSRLDPDALPTYEDESPEVLRQRLKVYQESVKAAMSEQLEGKKEEARLLALAYDAPAEHDELMRSLRRIPAPDGSIQDIQQQLTLVAAFIKTVTSGHAGQGPAPTGLDTITEEDLQLFKKDLAEMRDTAVLMSKIGGKKLDDIQTAITAFALQNHVVGAQLVVVPEWHDLQQQGGDRTLALLRATLLDKIQSVNKACDRADSFVARMRVGRDSLAPAQKMTQNTREIIEMVLTQLSTAGHVMGIDRVKAELVDAVKDLQHVAPPNKPDPGDGMLGGASTLLSLCQSINETHRMLAEPMNTLLTAWYTLVAGKPVPSDALFPLSASDDPTAKADIASSAPTGVPVAPALDNTSRLCSAFVAKSWLAEEDFTGTEQVKADAHAQVLQGLQQYGRCMDAQERAWGDVSDVREAVKCFYLGDILSRYALSRPEAKWSQDQRDAAIKSLWPAQTQAGGAPVDFQAVNPYDVRKLNSLLISINTIVMDRMKELGKVSSLRAANEAIKVRFANLQDALHKQEEVTKQLIEVTRQSIDKALGSERVLAQDSSAMDDVKLFLLGEGPNNTFNIGRNVLKRRDSSLDWSRVVPNAPEEVTSFRDRTAVRNWFSSNKRRITPDKVHQALQSMIGCARFLASQSAFTEEDDMLTEIHEIRRALKEHLDALKASKYDDAFFNHVQDLSSINDTWYKRLKDEEQTRQLHDFENQILRVLVARPASKGLDHKRITEQILSEMLAKVRELQGLVTAAPARAYVAELEDAVNLRSTEYRRSTTTEARQGAIVKLLSDIREARSRPRATSSASNTREAPIASDVQETATPTPGSGTAADSSAIPETEGSASTASAAGSGAPKTGGADPSLPNTAQEAPPAESGSETSESRIEEVAGATPIVSTAGSSWTDMIDKGTDIPPEHLARALKVDVRLETLITLLPIPDAVDTIVTALQDRTEESPKVPALDKLKELCVSLYRRVEAGQRSSVRKLCKAVAEMIATRDFPGDEFSDEAENELKWADLSGPQSSSLTSSLQGVLQALGFSPGSTSTAQRGGANLIDTATDSLRTLFRNVNAVASLLIPDTADRSDAATNPDVDVFNPDQFLQIIHAMSDGEAVDMVKKLKELQESLRIQLLANPTTVKPTEAGILTLVLQQAVSYIELRQSCSTKETELKRDFAERMQALEAKCAQDVSIANEGAQKAKAALIDAESSDVSLSPVSIVYAFRSIPRAHILSPPEARTTDLKASAPPVDVQATGDENEQPPLNDTSPPPLDLNHDTAQTILSPPPLNLNHDAAQTILPSPLDLNVDTAQTIQASTEPKADAQAVPLLSSIPPEADLSHAHTDGQDSAPLELVAPVRASEAPVRINATAPLDVDTEQSNAQGPIRERPADSLVTERPASEDVIGPPLQQDSIASIGQPESDSIGREDGSSLGNAPGSAEKLNTQWSPDPVGDRREKQPLVSPSSLSDRPPISSLGDSIASEPLVAPEPQPKPPGPAPQLPVPTAPTYQHLLSTRVTPTTQQGRKLEVVSDKALADLRAFDWRTLAANVGSLVRQKLNEPGTLVPELLPPGAPGMSGGADIRSDWKRDLLSATLACYVMHAILMRTPEIIRMVSVTETNPEGESDTFIQAILNHSGQDTALCRAFLDAVFVDVTDMRLPEDRMTTSLSGFASAIDRDSAIGRAQWMTLGDPDSERRRCVRVDDFFRYSCLLLRALTESQSDRAGNQDDMYRDALYVIGQVVRTRSEALADPLNSLNLEAYRRVTTLNLGELKESHSRSGRSGVLTYLKLRNDVAGSWNQRMYPSWDDERFGTEVYMQFNNHPFPYYDRATRDGNVMPMVDMQSVQRWGLKSADGRKIDVDSYKYHYLLGPFTRVFGPDDDAARIAAESTDIKKALLARESIFLIGYGASGAGKTSTLICRSGSRNNCAGKDSGVLLNILQDRDISSEYPRVTLTVCEFLAGEGDPGIADARSKKIADVPFMFTSGVYSFDAARSATQRYEGRWSASNSLDLANDPTSLKPYNLSKVIAHTIDTDRLVKATTNNPNSSRSHVLVFIRLDPDDEDGPCLVVGDFAGVENEFVCDSIDTLMQIYNQRDSVGQRMYTSKDLQTDRESRQQGRCKVPSQIGGADDDFVLYNNQTLPPQAILARQKKLLEEPGLLERLCGHSMDRALLSTLSPKLEALAGLLEGAYPATRAKADVSTALNTASAEREEAMYMAGDNAARLDGLLPALRSTIAVTSSAALWNGKRDADNTPAISRTLTILKAMYQTETVTVEARKNEPQWKGKVTSAVELDMLASEMHSSRPGSMLGVLGLDATGFGSRPRTSPKTPANDGAIVWLERSATKFSSCFKVIKQAFPDQTAEVAEVLLVSWLAVHFAEFWSRGETLMSMRSVCACRTHEGVFINDSLHVIRDVIRDLVQHQQAKLGRLMMAPAFSDLCLPVYCNPLAESCWGSSDGRSDVRSAADTILDRDRSKTRVMSMLLEVIGPRAAEKLRVAVFCILLMNRSENNDPMVPFIDAEDLRAELARIEKSNRNSIVKKMLSDGFQDTLASYNQLPNPPTIDPGVIATIRTSVTLLAPKLGQGLAQRMLSLTDVSQSTASRLLTMLDRVNAVHPVGTLQFVDSLAKFNLTDALCRFSCDSKLTFTRSLFERVVQSLENGQLGDFRSIMEDNLRMREYLRPPRDPVAAITYDAAAKSGWLDPKPTVAAKTKVQPSPKSPAGKRPASTLKKLGGGLSSGFNPCTVDEFLMQWARAVSGRIANGEQPVNHALYSDFLLSCEEKKRAEKERAQGFKSLHALIEPMHKTTGRRLPRRKSRRVA